MLIIDFFLFARLLQAQWALRLSVSVVIVSEWNWQRDFNVY